MSDDTTTRRVAEIFGRGFAEAYDLPRARYVDPTCTCTHELSAHHGPTGEGRCGETGCPCTAFAQADASSYGADDDSAGASDHNRRA